MILTIKQLQEVLGISRGSVYRYIEDGMPHFRVGDRLRFEQEEVIQWFKDRSKKE